MADQENNVRTITGKVVSDKMDKTITVLVERRAKHELYGKYITRATKLNAHDEINDCNEGDTVSIVESRPMSKKKTWKLQAIVEKAAQV